ncbi:hypothetical protein GCM10027449_11560 [Sinomonas notoginsengisoli]|uniref:4-hydroxythreonine-4-phosphate dehydrogenase PdxA n=1 Tax=Sinomonas notoginsengisoli TaxID=1457311 RepID=UPI001F1CA099|nr:4-hydroxythreonine-4-phosphate dehydrogenase PdxA [Sinomonas notoginsengisoli]
MATVLVQADDFSGAAEVGQQFAAQGFAVRIALRASVQSRNPTAEGPDVLVVDTHSRGTSAPEAAAAVKAVFSKATGMRNAVLFKKTDSLWRGNIRSEVSALTELGYHVVLAGALPAMGRTVIGGKPFVAGLPLRSSDLWRAEAGAPPADLGEVFAGTTVRFARLEDVRSGSFARSLAAAPASGPVAITVVDSETEEDLAAVVDALGELGFAAEGRPIALAGTGQLAGLLARRLAAETAHNAQPRVNVAPPLDHESGRTPVLAVVGSASPSARRQLEHLAAEGFDIVTVDAQMKAPERDTQAVERLRAGLADGRSVAFALVDSPVDPEQSAGVVARLAHLAQLGQKGFRADLILTGGETAREVLEALGIATLTPYTAVQHGAVVSLADDGRLVATKPGSFGDELVLAQLYRQIASHPSTMSAGVPAHSSTRTAKDTETRMTTEHDDRPFIAVTMGDGAGIGPEVTLGALVHPGAYTDSRPVVIGDAHRLRLAGDALGIHAEVMAVKTVAEAAFTPGRVNVIDPEILPHDLPWGEESAEAGNAAYHYVRIACELAMAGQVQGICTAPLNKAALHKAGHLYPGHTELLAHFMGVDEVSMMLSTPKVKVIHVTTHIGLVDAIRRIEPGLVERTVRRGEEAMKRAGVARPKIGVCAINPHAGENGLFGYGEEEEKITPAIERLQADGIDARGPLPADTAFFLAGRGDYDLIVAMYHDQGHGPVKVLGIEAGVNITVGLPVIRTSVDHGTAFDIAGKGIADVRSMIEALRQAAEMSPRLVFQP